MIKKEDKNNEETKRVWRPYNTRDYSVEEIIKEFDEFKEYCSKTIITNQYWNKIPKPLSVAWFCSWLGKGKNYIWDLARDDNYKGAILYLKTCMEEQIWDLAMAWVYNPTIASKNLSANFDWKEKSEVKQENSWEIIFKIKE